MTLRPLLCLALLAAAACADFPRDTENTLKEIKASGSFRVGIVAPNGVPGLDPKVLTLLKGLERASGAKAQFERGEAEPLLDRLKQGEIDLVIARFEKKSPWKRLVSFSPPLRIEQQGKTEFHLVAAMTNGENAWISLVESEARNVAPEAQ